MTDEAKPSPYKCSVCGESINMSRNNYRVVGIGMDHAWLEGKRGEPPVSIFKHKFCMDPDEWKNEVLTVE